ncbi:MAG: hypothetical protein AAGI50_01005 [Pseudomonadota bacterium]
MGAPFESWDAVEGAYYIGAGSGMEWLWLLVSIGLCVLALVMGARHELDAYKEAEDKS